jgi:adenylate cyclase
MSMIDEREATQKVRPGSVSDETVRLERREWRLWTLAILTILWLTLGILVNPLAHWFGLDELPMATDAGTSIHYLGLVALVMSLCLYLIHSYRETNRLRDRNLAHQREMQGLASDVENLRSLFKVIASINSEMDLPSLLRMIVHEAATTLGADQSTLMLLDKSRTILQTVATHGVENKEVRHAKVRLGEGVAGWVAQYGKPRLIHGEPDTREFQSFQPKDRPISSAVCVPLQMQGKMMGVLNVNLMRSEHLMSDQSLRLLMIYANHAAVAMRNAALLRESKERAKLRSILEGYVSPPVARTLMKDPGGLMNVGDVRDLTVLFADIRGFTRVVHQLGPQGTRAFLNQFFTRMTEVLFEHHGTLDKFIGDSVMAFFGAPLKLPDPVSSAVDAACSMQASFVAIQRQWAGKNPVADSLSLGIGISTGQLFVGNVGSSKRFDYTVIGQEVNVAKRLCDMAQGGQILISETTRNLLPSKVHSRPMGEVRFKGLDRSIHVFEVDVRPPPARGSGERESVRG